jgi:hypothetical protein
MRPSNMLCNAKRPSQSRAEALLNQRFLMEIVIHCGATAWLLRRSLPSYKYTKNLAIFAVLVIKIKVIIDEHYFVSLPPPGIVFY